jgi:hypothetical protein
VDPSARSGCAISAAVEVPGVPWEDPDEEVWLVVEVSAVVDRDEVERSLRRRELLARAGRLCLPPVAGDGATPGARDLVAREAVVIVEDGHTSDWDQALSRWLR